MRAQYITLQAWAARKFDPAPHSNTLHRWARDGMIIPAPCKIGRDYMVTPDAVHVNEPAPSKRLIGRINGLSPA